MNSIKKLRLQRGWSQGELARRSGVSQSHIHYLESGEKDATTKILQKLANALGVSISELLDETDESATA